MQTARFCSSCRHERAGSSGMAWAGGQIGKCRCGPARARRARRARVYAGAGAGACVSSERVCLVPARAGQRNPTGVRNETWDGRGDLDRPLHDEVSMAHDGGHRWIRPICDGCEGTEKRRQSGQRTRRSHQAADEGTIPSHGIMAQRTRPCHAAPPSLFSLSLSLSPSRLRRSWPLGSVDFSGPPLRTRTSPDFSRAGRNPYSSAQSCLDGQMGCFHSIITKINIRACSPSSASAGQQQSVVLHAMSRVSVDLPRVRRWGPLPHSLLKPES